MKVKRRTLSIGRIPEFARPPFTDSLMFPNDLTVLTAQNIAELMGKYAALLAYVEQEATTWTTEELTHERKVEVEMAKFLQRHPRMSHLERWRLELRFNQETSVASLRNRLAVIRSLKERAQSLVRTYDRLINVLSRELSRRLATNEGTKYLKPNF